MKKIILCILLGTALMTTTSCYELYQASCAANSLMYGQPVSPYLLNQPIWYSPGAPLVYSYPVYQNQYYYPGGGCNTWRRW